MLPGSCWGANFSGEGLTGAVALRVKPVKLRPRAVCLWAGGAMAPPASFYKRMRAQAMSGLSDIRPALDDYAVGGGASARVQRVRFYAISKIWYLPKNCPI